MDAVSAQGVWLNFPLVVVVPVDRRPPQVDIVKRDNPAGAFSKIDNPAASVVGCLEEPAAAMAKRANPTAAISKVTTGQPSVSIVKQE